IFPTGFIMILLLNLELVTGSFAVIPLAVLHKLTNIPLMIRNFSWAFFVNILGCIFYALLFIISITKFGNVSITDSLIAQKIITVAEHKTIAYKTLGSDGMIVVFVKALLCNWMITLGVVMAYSSTSTIGKIVAMWIPVFLFIAQGFEHAVVNLFVIPTGILLGANVTFSEWWLLNQIPVTFGNFVSGFLFTALALYMITRKDQLDS